MITIPVGAQDIFALYRQRRGWSNDWLGFALRHAFCLDVGFMEARLLPAPALRDRTATRVSFPGRRRCCAQAARSSKVNVARHFGRSK